MTDCPTKPKTVNIPGFGLATFDPSQSPNALTDDHEFRAFMYIVDKLEEQLIQDPDLPFATMLVTTPDLLEGFHFWLDRTGLLEMFESPSGDLLARVNIHED